MPLDGEQKVVGIWTGFQQPPGNGAISVTGIEARLKDSTQRQHRISRIDHNFMDLAQRFALWAFDLPGN